jgi:hypothetical protein
MKSLCLAYLDRGLKPGSDLPANAPISVGRCRVLGLNLIELRQAPVSESRVILVDGIQL